MRFPAAIEATDPNRLLLGRSPQGRKEAGQDAFEADVIQMQTTARRAVIETIINSDGDGWH